MFVKLGHILRFHVRLFAFPHDGEGALVQLIAYTPNIVCEKFGKKMSQDSLEFFAVRSIIFIAGITDGTNQFVDVGRNTGAQREGLRVGQDSQFVESLCLLNSQEILVRIHQRVAIRQLSLDLTRQLVCEILQVTSNAF